MTSKIKILVTGATGFLGRHLIKKLNKLNYEIFISNSKIGNLEDIKNLNIYSHIKFDYIFHLACITKAGDWCLYNAATQWEKNQIINTNILKYWKDFQPQAKMVAIGTSCSYSPELPMSEDNYMRGEPDEGLYTYAMTKRMLLQGLIAFNKQHNLNYIYFIPSTLYGSDYHEDDNHFIFDICRKIKEAKNNQKIVTLWGNGNQRRELIHVDDAIDLMLKLIDSEEKIVNLSSGEDFSIKEYAKTLCNLLRYDFNKIIFDENKYTGVFRKNLNVKKLKNLCPDFSFIPMNLGLKDLL